MSNTLEPNFNGLPKPTDWKKVIVPLQQANEKEFRGATLPELADEMLKDKTINGQRMNAVPPGALPAGPVDKEMYMELLSEGTWTFNGVIVASNPKGSILSLWWNKTSWSKDDSATLPTWDGVNEITEASLQSIKLSIIINNNPVNLVDPTKVVSGYIDANGLIVTSNDFISTDFIDVIPSAKVQFWARQGQAAWLGRIAYYNIKKDFIGYVEFDSSKNLIERDIPASVNGTAPAFIKISNSANYHTGHDIAIYLSNNNPKEVIPYDPKLFKSYDDSNTIAKVSEKDETIEVSNLLVNFQNSGTIGYLDNSLEPITNNDTFSKWYVTTGWIPISHIKKYILIIGNVFSYTVVNTDGKWFSGGSDGLNDFNGTATSTIIDITSPTSGGQGIAGSIRITFRRLDSDATILNANQTLSRCAVYQSRSGIGGVYDKVKVLNTDYNQHLHSEKEFFYVNNLFDASKKRQYPLSGWITGWRLGYYDGSVFIDSGEWFAGWNTSSKIVCRTNVEYVLIGSESYGVAFFDINRNHVGFQYMTSSIFSFKAISNAYYFSISIKANDIDNAAIYEVPLNEASKNIPLVKNNNEAVAKKETYKAIANVLGSSNLSDKSILALGDSITDHFSSYINQLSIRHGFALDKFSMDGTWLHRGTMADIPRVLSDAISVDATTSGFSNLIAGKNYDVVTIACAVNDRFDNIQGNGNGYGNLGNINSRDTTTFYGSIHVSIMTLRSLFPLSRIGFISQIPSAWQRYIEGNEDNLAYLKTKAILEMCAYHGVPVWVGCKNFGFNPLDNEVTKNTLMPDELHPNIAGHTWYANRIEDWLLGLFK